ncbi:MAG TPA: PAS domain S-box protein [Blastocatellia bacterium]|nr:PAS domain S-box protein [Blastocatellia bacterium]
MSGEAATINSPQPETEAARLEALRRYEILDTASEQAFDDLTQLAAQICRVPIVLISLVDDRRQWFKSRVGLSLTETPREVAFCAHAITGTDLFIVPDASEDQRFARNPLVTGEPGIRFYAGAPLLTPDGHALGTLCVLDRVPREPAPEQMEALRALSRQVMTQLELRLKLKESARIIAEHRQAEVLLRESERRFRTMADTAPVMIWMEDIEGRGIWFNKVWLEFTGRTLDQELGHGWMESVHPDDYQRFLARYSVAFATHESFRTEYRLRRADGTWRWMLDSGVPRFTPDGQFVGYIGSCIDITERKLTEAALSDSQAQMAGIIASAMDAIITVDQQQRITIFNTAAERMFGCPATEAIGQPVSRFIPERFRAAHQSHIQNFGRTNISRRSMGFMEPVYGLRSGGEEFPIEASISQVEVSGQKFFTVIIRDITERSRAEEQIRASLREKEVMLREIHHRVKNNLQVISSLLSLQSGYISDARATEMFRETQHRVRAMSLIHEKLYQSDNLARIDFKAYLESLSATLLRSHHLMQPGPELEIIGDDVSLSVNIAVPCGLIVNELLSNALKHAFPDGRAGRIRVGLSVGDGRMTLIVADNGIGLPEGFDLHQTPSFGLKLVSALARQLEATVTIHSDHGTEFRIIFVSE